MSSDIEIVRLQQLIDTGRAELQTGPFGTQLLASSYVESGTPVVAVRNIADNRLDVTDIPMISKADSERLSRYRLKQGDILFGRKGAVDRRALVAEHQEGWLQGSDCIRLRFDDSVDSKFISHLLGTNHLKRWLVQHAHGATMPSLNQQILGMLPLSLPPLDEQRRIAHILGTLDDKIELNRQMNRTLDEIARTLFRSWFVDFDPVRAKMDGRQPEGMDAATAALFPDRLVDSELGLIPEGWEVGPLTKWAEVLSGGTPKTSSQGYWGSDIPWFAMADLPSDGSPFVTDTLKSITAAGEANSSAKRVRTGTTILTARGTVGEVVIAGVDMAFNQSCYALRARTETLGNYTLNLLLRSLVGVLRTRTHGSVFATITRSTLDSLRIAKPDDRIWVDFEKVVSPLFALMLANSFESRTLNEVRNTMLPELLSGRKLGIATQEEE